MKQILSFVFFFMMITNLLACSDNDSISKIESQKPPSTQSEENTNDNDKTNPNMKIRISTGSYQFTATLENNATAKAFAQLLPRTINMNELNSNEKYFDLSNSLPTNSSSPDTIRNGDIMLYGSRTLVFFYKTFSTPYSYTRIGCFEDPSDLQKALGSGDVSVTFELTNN